MSIWTHVAATIRFDGLAGITAAPDLGKSVEYDSPQEDWGVCTVPVGSEGSLKTELWTNPDTHSITRYTATIFGDLRDYDDADEIIAYFKKITKDQMVRSR